MLRYKEWKSLNESYDLSLGLTTPKTVGVMGGVASFEEILEAKKKAMKKKMDFGGKDEEDDDDAETGDGEVVDPSSLKDKGRDDDMDDDEDDDMDDDESPSDDEMDHERDDDGDEDKEKNDNPVLMRMKNKMKKKMSSDKKKDKKEKKTEKKKMTAEETSDAAWWQSVHSMMGNPETHKNFDGTTAQSSKEGEISYGNALGEDSLMPLIDPNTGLIVSQADGEPRPGEVGFAPITRFGLGG